MTNEDKANGLKLTRAFEEGARWLWNKMTDAREPKHYLKNIRAEARRRYSAKKGKKL